MLSSSSTCDWSCVGTKTVPFTSPAIINEFDGTIAYYQSISSTSPYEMFSHEELRLADYVRGHKLVVPKSTVGTVALGGVPNNSSLADGANDATMFTFGGKETSGALRPYVPSAAVQDQPTAVSNSFFRSALFDHRTNPAPGAGLHGSPRTLPSTLMTSSSIFGHRVVSTAETDVAIKREEEPWNVSMDDVVESPVILHPLQANPFACTAAISQSARTNSRFRMEVGVTTDSFFRAEPVTGGVHITCTFRPQQQILFNYKDHGSLFKITVLNIEARPALYNASFLGDLFTGPYLTEIFHCPDALLRGSQVVLESCTFKEGDMALVRFGTLEEKTMTVMRSSANGIGSDMWRVPSIAVDSPRYSC